MSRANSFGHYERESDHVVYVAWRTKSKIHFSSREWRHAESVEKPTYMLVNSTGMFLASATGDCVAYLPVLAEDD
jgi:hypothetical protein